MKWAKRVQICLRCGLVFLFNIGGRIKEKLNLFREADLACLALLLNYFLYSHRYISNSKMLQTRTTRKLQTPSSASFSHKKVYGLDEEQQLEVKEAFDLFDPHQTLQITYHQLKVILRALGFDVKKSEVVELAKLYDVEESGRVAYGDYCDIMKRKYAQRDPIEETLKAFRLFDEEGKGKISLYDLKKVAKELGQTLKEEQLIAMIEEFDHDGDGYINQEQFLAIIKPSLS